MNIYEMKIGVDKAMQFVEGFTEGLGCAYQPAQSARDLRAKIWKYFLDAAQLNNQPVTDQRDDDQLELKSAGEIYGRGEAHETR